MQEKFAFLLNFSIFVLQIVKRIKTSKYFSNSIDSTSDEAHVDQLTFVFRYMEGENPVERFLTFLSNTGHKAKETMFTALQQVPNTIERHMCKECGTSPI